MKKVQSVSTSNKGFTLIELIIVMAVFIVVIIISSSAFEKIISTSKQLIKSAESNIEGVVGLEIMRTDLEHAGFGLPYGTCQAGQCAPSEPDAFVMAFNEMDATKVPDNFLAKGINPTAFNDSNLSTSTDPQQVPRAIQSATAAGAAAGAWELGRDYLVIKSTLVGMNDTANKWSYIEGSGASSTIKKWGAPTDFVVDERVITLDAMTRRLIGTGTSAFSYQVLESGVNVAPAAAFRPPDDFTNYLVYGVSKDVDLRAPYNRVDYYVRRPADKVPRCAPGTGTLYKAVLNHNGGGVFEYPLLDCVADMQVVYSIDATDDTFSEITFHDNENYFANKSAESVRKELKEVRVYILTHEGQKDRSYTHPSSSIDVGEMFGNDLKGRAYDLTKLDGIGDDWKHYRWKQYKLVVTPRNL